MIRSDFVNNEIYHIYNRGVEKRDIFLGRPDKFRFINGLFEFNNIASIRNTQHRLSKLSKSDFDRAALSKSDFDRPRDLLVEILAFCLMPNHYHLLLVQKKDKGITEFMRKLGTGYTNYFNKKYKRIGVLFQGKFKAVLIQKDAHFLHIPYYIHFNPLNLIESSWKEGQINDLDKAVNFLESYRWSSYLDYIGRINFPFIIQKDFLSSFYNDPEEHRKESIKWLKEIKDTHIEVRLR